MAISDTSTGMYMPVAPAGYGGGGFGLGGDSWAWIVILMLFGWGNGGFGGNGMNSVYPWMNQADITTSGFQNAQLASQLSGIQSGVTSGFGDIQTALCGGFAGVSATVNGAQNALAQQLYTNQISDLERSFAAQTASTAGMTNLQAQLASCCCDNRLATEGLKYTIAQENCADREALNYSTRDIVTAINSGVQSIHDQLCADKIEAKNDKILDLQNQLNMATFRASQIAQNDYLQNALTAQTQYFLGLYPPTAAARTTPAA